MCNFFVPHFFKFFCKKNIFPNIFLCKFDKTFIGERWYHKIKTPNKIIYAKFNIGKVYKNPCNPKHIVARCLPIDNLNTYCGCGDKSFIRRFSFSFSHDSSVKVFSWNLIEINLIIIFQNNNILAKWPTQRDIAVVLGTCSRAHSKSMELSHFRRTWKCTSTETLLISK